MFKGLMALLLVVAALAMVAYAQDLDTAEQRYGGYGRGGGYGGGYGGHRGGGGYGGHRGGGYGGGRHHYG